MNDDTIISLFLDAAEKYADNIAFNYFDHSWKSLTYRQFLGFTKSIASYLVKSGIRPGAKIAIVSENRVEWCASCLGILMAGGIVIPIDAQLGAAEISNILADSLSVLVFHSGTTELNIKGLYTMINFDSPFFGQIPDMPAVAKFTAISEEDLASIVYTSGTTGKPKGVMLTHLNFCSDAKALISANIVGHTDNVLSVLPLHHTYPFMCTFLLPLFLGATVTYPEGIKGPEIAAAMKEKGVSIFVAVPQLIELICKGILKKFREMPAIPSQILRGLHRISGAIRRTTGINIGKIVFKRVHEAFGARFRFFACGGARLDPEIMRDMEALGFTVLEGYGLTETSPVAAFNPPEKRKPGSAGRPLPSVGIKIVNPSDTGEGEVAISGPMVMKGYYQDPEATSQVLRDNWFLSGDLGYVDSENYIFLTGRVKEVIVLSSGKKIYPDEAEKEYLKLPLIQEICITASSENGVPESLQAVIVPNLDYARQEKIGNIEEALKWDISKLSITLPPYMRLKGFALYNDPLPRTPLGKLKRYMVATLLKERKQEAKKSKEEDKVLSGDEVGRVVIECLNPLLKEDVPISSSDNLELDLGLDSLQRIELVVAIESAFSIDIPETAVSEVHTVAELVRKIKELRANFISGPERLPSADIFGSGITDTEKKQIGLEQGALERTITAFFLSSIRLVFRAFFRFSVRGRENLPKPPFIIAPNHASNLDGFAIASALSPGTFRTVFFQGFQTYFTGWGLSLFGRLAHAIPIDPETFLGNALRLSSHVLKNGLVLCVFPEGGRSVDGVTMPFKKGIGILALKHNVPVVPTLIKGTFEALPKGSFRPKSSKVVISFGKPFYPAELDVSKKPEDIDEYQFFADELRERVKKLAHNSH